MSQINCCSSQSDMMMALLTNVIPLATFNTWISNYFSPLPLPPPPKTFPAQFILEQTTFPNNNCGCYVEVTNTDPNNTFDNTDIVFNVVPITAVLDVTCRYYTITLFNAFFAVLDPSIPIDSFGFTKANQAPGGSTPSNTLDIIFQINFTNGSTTYWDLSGTVPPNVKG